MPLSRQEQETVIRFDEAGELASLWTASSRVAARWRRAGLEVTEGRGSWWTSVSKRRVRIAKVRRATGRPFGTAAPAPPVNALA
jgi:hypothetical protein